MMLIVITWGIGGASEAGASSPIDADAVTVSEKFKLSDALGAAFDLFGVSAIDGDTIVVGSRFDAPRGSVHVFVRSGSSWFPQATLTSGDATGPLGSFGESVSISGDTIIVGSSSAAVGSENGQGAAYIFVRSGITWSQQAKLVASDGVQGDRFGTAIDISGDTVVVGAHLRNSAEGAAWAFVRTGTTWGTSSKLTQFSAGDHDRYGISVSVSGNSIAVGSTEDDLGDICCAGSVEIWVLSDDIWARQARLTADDAAEGAFFGSAVSIENDTLVVGARSDTVGGAYGRGSVYVFSRNGTTWGTQAKFPNTIDGTIGLGESIDTSGDIFVVGKPREKIGGVNNRGSVFVYSKTDEVWSQQAKITVSEGGNGDNFGMSVSVSGDRVVIGSEDHATGGNVNQGAAWAFKLELPTPPLPVIFVPGVAGSVIIDRNNGNNEMWFPSSISDLNDLSRYNTAGDNKVAPDVLRRATVGPITVDDVYGSFLEGLVNKGFREYRLNNGVVGDFGSFSPLLMTSVGCEVDQVDGDGKKPNLFLFPYDWRLDNAVNAAKLDDYIGCVRRIYPGSDVNMLTHSMGGLLVRRYVIDNQSDHHIDRWASIAAPWLGAPKLAYVLETGEFVPQLANVEPVKAVLRIVLGSHPAVHQLLPSQAYFDLGGDPVIEEDGVDINDNGALLDTFSGQDLYDLADSRYGQGGFLPGTIAKTFHTTLQDDWSSDPSSIGIDYLHIIGKKSEATTIEKFTIQIEIVCSIPGVLLGSVFFGCSQEPVADPGFTIGDGTVPILSAERISGSSNYNASGATLRTLTNADDDLVDHNGLMKNPDMVRSFLDFLAGGDGSGSLEPFSSSAITSAVSDGPGSASSHTGYHYVKVVGPSSVTVTNGSGTSTVLVNEVAAGTIPGVDVLGIGANAFMVLIPAGSAETFDLDFSAIGPISIEVLTGDGTTPNEAIRYQDLNLPADAAARLSFTLAGVQDLAYDSDGNGSLDATSSPTAILTGAAAADTTGPVITLTSSTTDFTAEVTLSASDSVSGVGDIFYSTDGTNFALYTGPLTLDLRASSTVHVFASDGAANRSSIVRTLAHSVTGSISLQGVTDQGVFTSIGPTVSVDLGGTSTSVAVNADGTFDLPGLVNGSYTVTVQAPGFLSAQIASVSIANASLSAPSFELRAGLVDGDGVVSIRDVSAVAALFGASGLMDRLDGQGRVVDLNGDGKVDILDVSAVASNFGVVSPHTWN